MDPSSARDRSSRDRSRDRDRDPSSSRHRDPTSDLRSDLRSDPQSGGLIPPSSPGSFYSQISNAPRTPLASQAAGASSASAAASAVASSSAAATPARSAPRRGDMGIDQRASPYYRWTGSTPSSALGGAPRSGAQGGAGPSSSSHHPRSEADPSSFPFTPNSNAQGPGSGFGSGSGYGPGSGSGYVPGSGYGSGFGSGFGSGYGSGSGGPGSGSGVGSELGSNASGAGSGAGAGADAGAGESCVLWGTTIDLPVSTRMFETFLTDFVDLREGGDRGEPLYPRLLREITALGAANLNLHCGNLFAHSPQLYRELVRFPTDLIPVLDLTVNRLRDAIAEADGIVQPGMQSELGRVQVRPFGMLEGRNMRELNPEDINTLVSVKGMVIRCGSVIPELKSAFFQCLQCAAPKIAEIDAGQIQEPVACDHCHGRHCMQLIHNRSAFSDKQLIRVQETPDAIPDGETPHTVTVFAYDELVDAVKPGDRVEITAVFRARAVRVNPRRRTVRAVHSTYLDAVHFRQIDHNALSASDAMVERAPDHAPGFADGDELSSLSARQAEELVQLSRAPDIYQRLVRSLAPSIFEMDDVKRGILCMLFGGTNNEGAGSGRFRGELNVLLCGDPGTSKSQLLQYVHKLAPRGIYTSGKGSSAVGLTAYVTRDPASKEMVLESGALVLSDRGVCCIDEFDKMTDTTRSILHEVMEQQTVSIAKAGIVCTLNARTSILASANPRQSRYNPRLSVVKNIELGPTLLSRFDLIYLILDQPNPTADRRLANHLISMYFRGAAAVTGAGPDAVAASAPATASASFYSSSSTSNSSSALIPTNTLKRYILYARKHIHPQLRPDAATALVEAYVAMRRVGSTESRKVVTATPRQLESLIRISEALARMRFSSRVTRAEVEEAARLMNVATQTAATDPTTGRIDMDLLTTGQSAADRLRADMAREQVRLLLAAKISAGRRTPLLDVQALLHEYNAAAAVAAGGAGAGAGTGAGAGRRGGAGAAAAAAATGPLSLTELRSLLAELEADGYVELTRKGPSSEFIKVLGGDAS